MHERVYDFKLIIDVTMRGFGSTSLARKVQHNWVGEKLEVGISGAQVICALLYSGRLIQLNTLISILGQLIERE